MVREIITIDEEKCNGCGNCVPGCPEGALQIIDGKARLVSDLHCDGLGACIGECPTGALMIERREAEPYDEKKTMQNIMRAGAGSAPQASRLQQWPVQLHLISPRAPYFQKADMLLAADCVAYAVGDFHSRYLAGKSLAVACPKLDSNQDVYVEKLIALIDEAKINTITVVLMEVPCCGGLLRLAKTAAQQASRKIPIKAVVVNLQGEELQEEWV